MTNKELLKVNKMIQEYQTVYGDYEHKHVQPYNELRKVYTVIIEDLKELLRISTLPDDDLPN